MRYVWTVSFVIFLFVAGCQQNGGTPTQSKQGSLSQCVIEKNTLAAKVEEMTQETDRLRGLNIDILAKCERGGLPIFRPNVSDPTPPENPEENDKNIRMCMDTSYTDAIPEVNTFADAGMSPEQRLNYELRAKYKRAMDHYVKSFYCLLLINNYSNHPGEKRDKIFPTTATSYTLEQCAVRQLYYAQDLLGVQAELVLYEGAFPQDGFCGEAKSCPHDRTGLIHQLVSDLRLFELMPESINPALSHEVIAQKWLVANRELYVQWSTEKNDQARVQLCKNVMATSLEEPSQAMPPIDLTQIEISFLSCEGDTLLLP